MIQAVVLILAGVTSAGAVLMGVRTLGLRPSQLRPSAGRMFECVGTILVFFGTNVTMGLVVILVSRSLTGAFVSTYSLSDVALLGVSCFQGLLFHCWREARRGEGADCRGPSAEC